MTKPIVTQFFLPTSRQLYQRASCFRQPTHTIVRCRGWELESTSSPHRLVGPEVTLGGAISLLDQLLHRTQLWRHPQIERHHVVYASRYACLIFSDCRLSANGSPIILPPVLRQGIQSQIITPTRNDTLLRAQRSHNIDLHLVAVAFHPPFHLLLRSRSEIHQVTGGLGAVIGSDSPYSSASVSADLHLVVVREHVTVNVTVTSHRRDSDSSTPYRTHALRHHTPHLGVTLTHTNANIPRHRPRRRYCDRESRVFERRGGLF